MRRIRGIIVRQLLCGICVLMLTGCGRAGHLQDKDILCAAGFDGSSVTMEFYTDEKCLTVQTDDISGVPAAAGIATGRELLTGHTSLIILSRRRSMDALVSALKEWKVSPECIIAVSDEQLLSGGEAQRLIGSVRRAQEQQLAPDCGIVTVLGELLGSSHEAEVPLLDKNGFCGTVLLKRDT